MSIEPSLSQKQLVSSVAHRLKVRAFAGSGKTFSALLIPKHHEDKRVLMLVFNKANATETNDKARSMGITNFLASTIHSIAYQTIWPAYKDSRKSIKDLSTFDISKHCGIESADAKSVLFALRAFIASGDDAPSESHFYSKKGHLLPNLSYIWSEMINPKSPLPLSMDAILKVFQLGKFQFDTEIIIADEYQDQTDCFAAIVESQRARVIAIGDEHQSIYGFRNAYGAMNRFKATEEIILSNCYRFGQGVALVASAILDISKSEPNILVGRGQSEISTFTLDMNKPFGVVCRTNINMIENAINACNHGYSINIIGGIEKAKPDLLLPLSSLYQGKGQPVTVRGTKVIHTWTEMKEYAKNTEDADLLSGIRLTESLQGKADELIPLLERNHVSRDEARIVLGTAHGWKGFEMDQIALGEDFKRPDQTKDAQDINLLYIAVTRAKSTLQLPSNILNWLEEQGLSIEMIDFLQKSGLNHKARHEVQRLIEEDIQSSVANEKAGVRI